MSPSGCRLRGVLFFSFALLLSSPAAGGEPPFRLEVDTSAAGAAGKWAGEALELIRDVARGDGVVADSVLRAALGVASAVASSQSNSAAVGGASDPASAACSSLHTAVLLLGDVLLSGPRSDEPDVSREVAQTVLSEEEVNEEILALFRVFAR